MILRLNEIVSKQYESSRFTFMQVVPNMEVFYEVYQNGNCVGLTTTTSIYQFLQKSFFPMTAAMCQDLPSFIQTIIINIFFCFQLNLRKKHSNPNLLRVYSRFVLFLVNLHFSFNFKGNIS